MSGLIRAGKNTSEFRGKTVWQGWDGGGIESAKEDSPGSARCSTVISGSKTEEGTEREVRGGKEEIPALQMPNQFGRIVTSGGV